MKTGRVSCNITERSIRKPMKSGGSLLPGFMQYQDCVRIRQGEGENPLVSAVCTSVCRMKGLETVLFYRGCNQLACQGAETLAVSAAFLLPVESDEQWLAGMTETFVRLCRACGAAPGQVSATVSDRVTAPVLTYHFLGKERNHARQWGGASKGPAGLPEEALAADFAGASLLAIGYAGMAGAALLAGAGKKELSGRYAEAFLAPAGQFLDRILFAGCEAFDAAVSSACYFHPVQEGGVFAALWYLSAGLGLGFEIDMKKIPIRQETVEICEFYRLNPYCLTGDGMLLCVTADAEEAVQTWERAGYQVSVLGCMTKEKRCILKNSEEIRYLDKPAQDELERFTAGGISRNGLSLTEKTCRFRYQGGWT